MTDSPEFLAFVSYPNEQLEHAREIWTFLTSIGCPTWFDKESLIGGQTWDQERLAAQRRADLTLLVWSEETAHREGIVQTEVKSAKARQEQMPAGHISLVVCRVDKTPVSLDLDTLHYIDISDNWRFKICRSIVLKYQQLQRPLPQKLKDFIREQEAQKSVELISLHEETDSVDFDTQYIVYKKRGLFWDLVNSEIKLHAIGGFLRKNILAKECLNEIVKRISWSLLVKEHYVSDGFVSLTFGEYLDVGGAHPSRGIYTRNFDEIAGTKLEMSDLFDRNPEVLAYLKRACEMDVSRQLFALDNSDADYSLDHYVLRTQLTRGRYLLSGQRATKVSQFVSVNTLDCHT